MSSRQQVGHRLVCWLGTALFVNSRLAVVLFTNSPLAVILFANSRLAVILFANSRLAVVLFTNSPLAVILFANSREWAPPRLVTLFSGDVKTPKRTERKSFPKSQKGAVARALHAGIPTEDLTVRYSVSKRTVGRAARLGGARWLSCVREPPLTARHRHLRLAFARKHRKTNFRKVPPLPVVLGAPQDPWLPFSIIFMMGVLQVVFSDETKVDLRPRQRQRWTKGDRKVAVVQHYPLKQQYWGALGFHASSVLVRADKMNTPTYTCNLQRHLLPLLHRTKGLTFQQVRLTI